MRNRWLGMLGVALGALTLGVRPAHANDLKSASGTLDCAGYNLSIVANDVHTTQNYHIDWEIDGLTNPVTGVITFLPANPPCVPGVGDLVCTETASGTWPGGPLNGTFTFTGSAFLEEQTPTPIVIPITLNGGSSVTLTCGGTGCPATIGYWKNHTNKWPLSVVSSGLTIGGVNYTAAQLLTILKATPNGNAVLILGKQLVGALLNLAAGATHNASADAAISDAEGLLQTNNLNLLTSVVAASSTLGGALTTDADTLNSYNNADFGTCTEASGLTR